MEGFVRNIEKSTEDNTDFRRVLYTGKHLQLGEINIVVKKPSSDNRCFSQNSF